MAATADELTSIRRVVGDTAKTVWSDPEIQATWTDAVAQHTESDRRVVCLQVIVDLFDELLLDNAKKVTYRQNSAAETLSDIFKNVMKLRDKHAAKLSAAIADTKSPVKIGVLKKKPRREKEWPDS